jgi:hypothetical protein
MKADNLSNSSRIADGTFKQIYSILYCFRVLCGQTVEEYSTHWQAVQDNYSHKYDFHGSYNMYLIFAWMLRLEVHTTKKQTLSVVFLMQNIEIHVPSWNYSLPPVDIYVR